MADRMSHEESHEAWSEAQFVAFRAMGGHDQISAVKAGALDHWTEKARNAAFDMLGRGGKINAAPETAQSLKFEPALQPLLLHPTRSVGFDRPMTIAATGWVVIITAVAGRAYGLF